MCSSERPGRHVRWLAASIALVAAACGSPNLPPLVTVPEVDLGRFMGDWHVIASIPTTFEKGARDAVETYRRDADGTIATTFRFERDGRPRSFTMRGFVVEGSGNAVWEMQPFWPIRADFRIVHLTPAYDRTIVAREKRDYAWIMARSSTIPDTEYQAMVEILRAAGYDTTRLVRVPHSQPGQPAR